MSSALPDLNRTLDLTEVDAPSATHHGSRRLIDVERAHIQSVLNDVDWRIEGQTGAAGVLGLRPSTLRSRMHKLGIRRPTTARERNGD